jgi:hypothetical protein
MTDYRRLKTPMQALRAILALGVDAEGDILIPGKAENCDELNLVKNIRRVARNHRGVK